MIGNVGLLVSAQQVCAVFCLNSNVDGLTAGRHGSGESPCASCSETQQRSLPSACDRNANGTSLSVTRAQGQHEPGTRSRLTIVVALSVALSLVRKAVPPELTGCQSVKRNWMPVRPLVGIHVFGVVPRPPASALPMPRLTLRKPQELPARPPACEASGDR